MSSSTGDKAFTQHWLQSLTLVAREPVAQQIKPLIDTVDEISRPGADADRSASAERLWKYADAEGLRSLLEILPVQQPNWVFDRDDPFVFQRTARQPVDNFQTWIECLGLAPNEVALTAEVASRDWLSLARQEAVRQQKSMSTSALPPGLNLKLACTAAWDLKSWSIRFDEAEWVVRRYEDPFSTERPALEDIQESMSWAIATASDTLLPKVIAKSSVEIGAQPWMKCVPRLEPLHQRVLMKEVKHSTPWFRRVWACVWPVVYREQNVLGGQANIDVIRQELAVCVKEVPRLTTWMFVFAKLVCESQLGRGLGISGGYLA